MSKAKNRFVALAAIPLLLDASNCLADVPFVFTDNTPAEAAQVNANFDDLNGRVDALEDPAIVVVDVDCSLDTMALQAAIDARPQGRQTINFQGTCSP